MNSNADEHRVLVIGYGNPLRGDDAVGCVVAQRLAELLDPDRVSIVTAHQLTPELADPISRAELVIFIDAAVDAPPGHVRIQVLDACPSAQQSMTHHVSPALLLALAQHVYGRCAPARLFTVGGEDFAHKEGLSPLVERAGQRLVQDLSTLIEEHLASCTSFRSHPPSSK